ncbi:MAG TPA: xanthine dehydrogenase family protein molybdopterin-binding subunit [Tepidisphaeraceae bacterium]|jgi:xanthine dehydrogenase YagR molybdenum-binding subunit|nr:xanthine dehydrogenase family protein molybdopterin-binding subunit [Tepidisphaeraceae bacterium]
MMSIPTIADPLPANASQVGRPLSRVDGRLKVTGGAKYAAEHNAPGLLHGYIVSSAITKGRITRVSTAAALASPGVVHVFTHENRPSLAWFDRKWKDEDSPKGSPFRPLYDAKIVHAMQPIALVVAETFEAARCGARLVEVEYEAEHHETDLRARRHHTYTPGNEKTGFEPPPKPRGDADAALKEAPVKVDAEYEQAAEHHNPMEMHASTVIFHEADDSITVYDKTQGVQGTQKYVCNVFGLPKASVRVLAPFVGGAFGSGLRAQHQLFLAVMASTQLKRSVRVELTRPQMFTFGHRPQTIQRVALGAAHDGTLTAVIHEAVQESSQFENYVETVVNWSGQQYKCENVRLEYKLARLDLFTPLDMRAPGAATGLPALECAMDELAYALKIDPVELRLKNYADVDGNSGKPFSSKELKACFAKGAERFGWARRNPEPRSMRDGKHLIGWGMASGVWDAMQVPASAKAALSIDGRLIVSSATADIGTGTYTAMSQIAADTLGIPMEQVRFILGDSSLPQAPLEGGSFTVSSVGSAVKAACDKVGARLLKLARKAHGSPLADAKDDAVEFADGRIRLKNDPARGISIVEAMRGEGIVNIEEQAQSIPNFLKHRSYKLGTHSAVFVEVRVDPDLGTVGVSRVVSAVAAGRIINPKTAASQVAGAVVGGIGMALLEETLVDHTLGRYMNHDFAEYHVPVNADVPDIDVIFVEEHDDIVNPLGVKGVGEIGIVGVPAAIANAIFHATGKRIRQFPITPDKVFA